MDKDIAKALRVETRALDASGEEVTVNKVRKAVVEKLGLDEDFFKDNADWKSRSKEAIVKALQENADNGSGDDQDQDEVKTPAKKATKKNCVKRQSSNESEQKSKRAKKDPAPKKAAPKKAAPKKAAPKKPKKAVSESELSDLAESSEEEKPKKRGAKPKPKTKKADSESELSDLHLSEEELKPKKAAGRGRPKKKRATLSDNEDDEDDGKGDGPKDRAAEDATGSEAKNGTATESNMEAKSASKSDEADEDKKPEVKAEQAESKQAANDDSSELSSVVDDLPSPKEEGKPAAESKTVEDDDSSELSSVIDEPPPKKRRQSKDPKGAAKPKVAKAAKAAPKEATGDEAEIKKLQGQLVKCGIRKIWGIELKEFGDDSKGKIRHLRKLLADVGITGRFSEARAKEVKERRELMADLEAVQQMDDLWGAEGRGGRASRSKARQASLKEQSDDGSGAEDAKPRVSKRMADLAFLGSESESE